MAIIKADDLFPVSEACSNWFFSVPFVSIKNMMKRSDWIAYIGRRKTMMEESWQSECDEM
jgi:hypothetical protein